MTKLAIAFVLSCIALQHMGGQPSKTCATSTVDSNWNAEDAARARAFVGVLQSAVQSEDADQVARFMRFPLRVPTLPGGSIKDRRAFRAIYRKVFTKEVRAALLAPDVKRCLFANWQGFMVGNGAIWFNGSSTNKLKVITVNVPRR